MLISLEVRMRPRGKTWFNVNSARSMHGLFFALLRRANPPLASRLHPDGSADTSATRPTTGMAFTCSDIHGEFEPHRDGKCTLPDQVYSVRFTAYEPSVCAALNAAMTDRAENSMTGLAVEVRDQTWDVMDVIIEPNPGSNHSGVITFKSIIEHAQIDDRIELQFMSPTAISMNAPHGVMSSRIYQLFPTPESIFCRYQQRWNAHATGAIETVYDACAGGAIVVDRYDLSTRLFAYDREVPLRGFVGTCSYRIRTRDIGVRRDFNALADFAYFAGTGIKTTQGMGQTRRVDSIRRKTHQPDSHR